MSNPGVLAITKKRFFGRSVDSDGAFEVLLSLRGRSCDGCHSQRISNQ